MRVPRLSIILGGPLLSRATKMARSPLVLDTIALTAATAAGNLAQLIALPFLARVLGPAEWGRTAWMMVIVSYFVVVVDWGFSWRGTSRMASMRHQQEELSRIFVAGWTIQVALALLSIAVLATAAYSVSELAPFRPYVLYSCLWVAAGAIFPQWLPFGLERVREVAMVQFAIRIGSVPLIFLFVRGPADGPVVIQAMAVSQIVASSLGLIWMLKNIRIVWQRPSWEAVKLEFLGGGAVLISRVWAMLYTTAIPSVLGAMTNTTVLGFYLLADRLRAGIVALLTPLVQALLPRMSFLMNHDRENARRLLLRFIVVIALMGGGVCLALLVGADVIVHLVGGRTYAEATSVLRWFAPLPLIVLLSTTVGLQILIPAGKIKVYNRALVVAGVTSVATIYPLIRAWGADGAAITMLIGETVAAVGLITYVYRHRAEILSAER